MELDDNLPLVSVIIPVYNVAKLLERCVNSVLAQTYQNLEIILVDDGSTDMSGKFCDVFKKKDSRVRVVHQENRGLSGARNTGLDLATGDFVTFVDSDDSISNDLVELLVDLCRQYETKLSICGFAEFSANSETFPNLEQRQRLARAAVSKTTSWPSPPPNLEDSALMSTTACLVEMLCERGFSMSAWGKLYARELFLDARFPEGKLYEDVGTTYRLVLQCPTVAISPAQKYNYYLTTNSLSRSTFSRRNLDLIELTDKMCDDLIAWSATRDVAERTELENLVKKRRVHARFSILRLMLAVDPKSLPSHTTLHSGDEKTSTSAPFDRKSFFRLRRSIARYLRKHRSYVFRNPLATRRDKLAMRSLEIGLPAFKFAWQTYTKRKARD